MNYSLAKKGLKLLYPFSGREEIKTGPDLIFPHNSDPKYSAAILAALKDTTEWEQPELGLPLEKSVLDYKYQYQRLANAVLQYLTVIRSSHSPNADRRPFSNMDVNSATGKFFGIYNASKKEALKQKMDGAPDYNLDFALMNAFAAVYTEVQSLFRQYPALIHGEAKNATEFLWQPFETINPKTIIGSLKDNPVRKYYRAAQIQPIGIDRIKALLSGLQKPKRSASVMKV